MVLESGEPEKPPTNVETCLRGFSFMPDTKVEMNLQFIEGEELERTWRTTRRERLKEREQKIWDEFVKEQDILGNVCQDDPYQFLEQLPESCIKELLELELQKMKKEKEIEEKQEVELKEQKQGGGGGGGGGGVGGGDSPRAAVPAVTFADDDTGDDSDLIHIFDDEKADEQSGPEDEVLNDSLGSPCTVRDKFQEKGDSSPSHSPDKGSNKSSENVTNMIESSIYCAKVRDVRMKINEELGAIVESLERRDIYNIDPEDLVKMCRRSSEFCARFNRIYMYQLHRQIHDLKRNNNATLPLARHTHFQAQMVRIVSLHQNLLQSLQIFHKSFEQTSCVRESCELLRCLLQVTREGTLAALAAPPPRHLHAARGLYADEVLPSCDKVDETVNEYAAKMDSYINSTSNTSTSGLKRPSRSSTRRKSVGTWSKSGSKMKSQAESRLSMYSLDTLRINLHSKSSSSKDNQSSGTSKVRGGVSVRGSKQEKNATNPDPQKTPRKSPKTSRRPLMRDPQSGRARRQRDSGAEIRTMVEAVEACTSSHISREASPRRTGSAYRRSRNSTPRLNKAKDSTARRSLGASPRAALRSASPKKPRRPSPKKATVLKAVLSSIKTDPLCDAESSIQIKPVSKIRCAKKENSPKPDVKENSPRHERDKTPRYDSKDTSPRYEHRDGTPRYEQRDGTPRHAVCESPRVGYKTSPRQEARESPRTPRALDVEKAERDRSMMLNTNPGGRCEVTRIVRQLCGGDAAGCRSERVSGAKNAQLLCINGTSPRQPSTPQLLRILEETIQKKVPKTFFPKTTPPKGTDRFRMTFNIPDRTAENLFQYRTKFVQHMLASPMYANCAVGKPWEMVGCVSEQLIDELLSACARDMQLRAVVQALYRAETT